MILFQEHVLFCPSHASNCINIFLTYSNYDPFSPKLVLLYDEYETMYIHMYKGLQQELNIIEGVAKLVEGTLDTVKVFSDSDDVTS